MYYVYIIQSKSNKTFYTGMTSDIDRRMAEHNGHHGGTRTTLNLCDYELVFCQIVDSRIEARWLEKYLKSGTGREVRGEIIASVGHPSSVG